MRREYEMSEEQYQRILKASQPVPAMTDSHGNWLFGTPEENANRAWQDLGRELGFKWDTAQIVIGKSNRFFTAEPL